MTSRSQPWQAVVRPYSCGNTDYGKRGTSQTIGHMFEENLHSHQSFWYECHIRSTFSSAGKHSSETNAINDNLPPIIGDHNNRPNMFPIVLHFGVEIPIG